MRRRLTGAALVVVAATVGALAWLWPRGEAPDLGAPPQRFVTATVVAVTTARCDGVEASVPTRCRRHSVTITSGADEGTAGAFVVRDTQFDVPVLEPGDDVVLLDAPGSPPPYRYAYADRERSQPLWLLAGAFVVVVVLFSRRQGVQSLLGLAASGLLLVVFLVPALLRDGPAVPVALAAGATIAAVALYTAHGLRPTTTVALLGTLASLLGVAVLAHLAVDAAHLTGLADPDTQVIRLTAASIDLRGLLIAGIVIGALGSLDDVTVTQVATVTALRRADPGLDFRSLNREALRVGRDHVAASVNTLVLAYAGAALPLLLFFSQGGQPVARLVTGEVVAVELVRMLVGSIGLIAAVPTTTALAAYALGPRPPVAAHGDPAS